MKIACKVLFQVTVTLASAFWANAAVYRVGPGRAYTTLQQVVDLLNPGDMVPVDGDAT